MSTLAINYYIFIMTRCLVRTEALLTQLLFDQALRLRMKDSVGDEDEKAGTETGTATPAVKITTDEGDQEQPVDASQQAEGSSNGATNGESNGETNGTTVKDPEEPTAPPSKSQGLVGKINVLMASDIESVGEGEYSVSLQY